MGLLYGTMARFSENSWISRHVRDIVAQFYDVAISCFIGAYRNKQDVLAYIFCNVDLIIVIFPVHSSPFVNFRIKMNRRSIWFLISTKVGYVEMKKK